MRLIAMAAVSVWATIYTGSLSLALWKRRNYRGSIGVALLALCTLVFPTVIHMVTTRR